VPATCKPGPTDIYRTHLCNQAAVAFASGKPVSRAAGAIIVLVWLLLLTGSALFWRIIC
jgi:glycerol-3-phosphate acyltransferase PlsY